MKNPFLQKNSLVLVKVSKTGTSSLQEVIPMMFGEGKAHRPRRKREQEVLPRTKSRPLPDFLLCHHLSYSPKAVACWESIMRRPPKLLGSVRSPLQRAMSHYYFNHRRRVEESFSTWMCRRGNLGMETPWKKWHWFGKEKAPNFILNYLGYTKCPTKDELRSRYFHIFVLEDLELSLRVFAKKTGTRYIAMPHCNKRTSARPPVSAAARAKFTTLNEEDLKLWHMCKEILHDEAVVFGLSKATD